jgi:magnesium chelatase subunit D
MSRRDTPFPAIVGQPDLKRALLAVAANDALDGVLVRGERGTGKSTAVRGLADLLPEQRAVADCRYGCAPDDPERQCASCRDRAEPPVETRPAPLVTLPLGATRERVVGTLSVEGALDGDAEFDPGLLARANRGLLYVDEVNLLDDHLVDVLLDAAASGVNRVERDGVSVEHPAEFTLIGTMNPEEGDLRPQLRDRFSLQTTVVGTDDLDERVAIIDQALGAGGEAAAEPPAETHHEETAALRDRLQRARERLDRVELPAAFKAEIAELCRDAGVDGHRADVATARTAITLAALEGRSKVIESDVKAAASYALPHRLRRQPFDDATDVEEVLDDHFDEGESDDSDGDVEGTGDATDGGQDVDGGDREGGPEDGEESTDGGDEADERDDDGSTGTDADSDSSGSPSDGPDAPEPGGGDDADGGAEQPVGASTDDSSDGSGANDEGGAGADDADGTATPLVPGEQRAVVGDASAPPIDDVETERGRPGSGSRTDATAAAGGRGARVRTERAEGESSVDAAASIRAAAAEGRSRVEARDLRTSVRAGTAGTRIVFVVDASASMRPAMRAAKGTVLSVLEEAYQRRDEVAFVAVAGDDAEVLLPPTDSVALAARHLKELPTGDRTPLPAGLDAAGRLVAGEEEVATLVVVVTDGRANVAGEGRSDDAASPTRATRAAARRLADTGASVVLVDAGDDGTGVADIVASETDARRIPLDDLSPERVADAAAAAADGE